MGRMRERHPDQGFTRSYLKGGNPWSRITGGDPGSVLWLRLLPLLAMTPLVLFAIDERFLRYTYLVFTFPVLTALVNGPLATAAAVLAVAAFVASGKHALGLMELPASSWLDVAAVVSLGSLSVLLAWIRDRVVVRLLGMTDVAETTQRAILRDLPEQVGALRVASVYRTPVGSVGLVGGDFFDVEPTDYGVRVVIGDVQGHDLPAVQVTEAVLGSFREGVLDDADLVALAARLERRVSLDNRGRDGWEQIFATVALIEVPPGEASVRVVLCGHPAPLLVQDGVQALSPQPHPPLGVAELHDDRPEVLERPLRPGDLVVAFTDGLIEAKNARGETFPLQERVEHHALNGHRDPARLRAQLRNDFYEGGYQRSDDTSLLILQVPAAEADS